jgi:hypothetical protein
MEFSILISFLFTYLKYLNSKIIFEVLMALCIQIVVYLFIYGPFNNPFSSSDYMTSYWRSWCSNDPRQYAP